MLRKPPQAICETVRHKAKTPYSFFRLENCILVVMDIKLTGKEKIKILNSDAIYGIMQKILLREGKTDQNREHFWVIGLENNNYILFIELISLDTVNQMLAEPMEVFSLALQKRTVKIILCHNHPSRELKLSDADLGLLEELKQSTKYAPSFVLEKQIKKEVEEIAERKKAIEIARELKRKGIEEGIIASSIGLSLEETQKLRVKRS